MTYDKNIHDKQRRRIIEESIAKIPSIKGNGLKHVIVEIAKGNFVGYGGYNADNEAIKITLASEIYVPTGVVYLFENEKMTVGNGLFKIQKYHEFSCA